MNDVVLSTPPRGIYEQITEKIIAAIETGTPSYRMPWHSVGVPIAMPMNAQTKRPYRGINVLSLWAEALDCRYPGGYWASYRQWQALGAQVRKGARGTLILFYLVDDKADEEAEATERSHRRFIARPSWVFNAGQVDGWDGGTPAQEDHVERWEVIEDVVRARAADVRYGSHRACYHPVEDFIEMPYAEWFVSGYARSATESFYSTLLHELTHWSGHASRLDRDLSGRFGGEAYAMEELVAELGAAFLCGNLGISNEPRLDHASYLSSWLTVLKRDSKALVTAAGKAATAADFVLQGLAPQTESSA